MKFSDYLKTGKNRYGSFDEMITDLSTQKNEREKEAEHQRFLQGVGNEVQTYANDWQNFWMNGGAIGTSDYSNLTIAGAKLDQRLKNLQKEYAGNEQATSYFSQLSDALTGMRSQEYDLHKANNYKKLFSEFQGVANTLDSYSAKVNNGEWMSADDLSDYSAASKEYSRIGDQLFTEEYGYTPEEIQGYKDSSYANVNLANSAYGIYKGYANEEAYDFTKDWNKEHGSVEARQNWYNGLLTRKRQLSIQMEEELAKATSPTEPFEIMRRYGAMIDKIDAEISKYERGETNEYRLSYGVKALDDFYYLTQNDDFYVNSKRKTAVGEAPTDDRLGLYYDILSGRPGFADVYAQGQGNSWDYLDSDDVSLYYYILNTQGSDKAQEFLSALTVDLNRRETNKNLEEWQKAYDESGFLGKAWMNRKSIPANVISGVVGTLENLANNIGGGDINPYTAGQQGMHYANTVRSAMASDIDEATGGASFLGISVSDVYQAAMSRADSMLSMALFGGTGGSLVLGMGAAQNKAYDLYKKGASSDQTLIGSLAAGAAEMAFEKIAFGKLEELGNAGGFGGWLKNMAAQGFNEFLEEAETEIANIVSDYFVMGNQSDLTALLNANNGDWGDTGIALLKQVYEAGASGFIGGVGAGGLQSAKSKVRTNAYNRAIGKEIIKTGGVETVKGMAAEGESSRRIDKLSSKVTEDNTRKNRKLVGQLYSEATRSIGKKNANANAADVAQALQEGGISTSDASRLANAIIAKQNGTATEKQNKLVDKFAENDTVHKVMKDLVLNNESTVGERSKSIREFNEAIGYVKGINKAVDAADQRIVVNKLKKGGIAEEKVNDIANALIALHSGEATKKQKKLLSEFNSNDVVAEANQYLQDAAEDKLTVDTYKAMLDRDGLIADSGTEAETEAEYEDMDTDAMVSAFTDAGIDLDTAQYLAESFDAESGSGKFAHDVTLAFKYGKVNFTEGLKNLSLPESQANEIFNMGANSVNVAKTEQASTKKIVKDHNANKPIYYDNFTYNKHQLNETQRASMEAIHMINKLSNLEIHVYKSYKKDGRYYTRINGVERAAPNGYFINGNQLHIDLNAGNMGGGLMLYTLSHEIGHYIAQWNPEDFKAISDFLFEHYSADTPVLELLEAKKDVVRRSYERDKKAVPDDAQLEKEAQEELVCDMLSKVLADQHAYDVLMELKQKDLRLFKKLGRAIKLILQRLGKAIGVYKDQNPDAWYAAGIDNFGEKAFRELQELYVMAFEQADANFQEAEKNTTEDGDVKMQTRTVNGEQVVWIENSGFTNKQLHDYSAIAEFIAEHIGEYYTIIESGQNVYIGEDLPSEYTHSKYTSFLQKKKPALLNAKNRASTALGEMIEIATNRRWEPTGHKASKDAKYGMYRYDTKFAFPIKDQNGNVTNVKAYDAELLIRNASDGKKYLYDIVNIKEDTTNALDLRHKEARKGSYKAATQGDVVNKNVSQGTENVKSESTEALDIEVDTKTESVAPKVMNSERTWTESDYVQEREQAAKEISKAIGVSVNKAKAYIDSVNSIAKMIAEDRVRLDYFSSPGRSSFVGNVEYGGSFDFSTLCKKRRLLTGTFTAIQKALPNTALTANEILDIRNRMKEAGLEVSCGLCYVEGSRANMGQFAKEFLKLYKQYYPDAWQPNMADVNTPDGIEWVRINHPECYEQYEYFWNHYGTLKPGDKNLFASQQKPKLYQLHTEYKGEILKKFNDDDNVEEKNLNGGIRLQSFSDFEIVHLIDTMQIIMDMSRVGLAGQAYTKVPDFAWALGDTGLKINLSLIAKGVDENGKLIFDDVEGMPIDEAMKLRDRYSKNVGTILVAFNDAQLLAAMADDRVDFIIPFHRSQWKKSQYEAMGLPAKTKDYTYMQNEKYIKPQYHEYRDRMVKDKATNYMPNEYWDFSKSGKENAEAYLEMCARNNKRPKFYKLLQNNGDGSYSLKADGSTDGYWKMLIDFKMYDNSGKGSPQMPVKPDFNMDEATRMLEEYKGGHSNFPVAQGVVDRFVSEYKSSHQGAMYSERFDPANNDIRFQERTEDSVSNRSLLANAFEGTAKNDIERKKLADYQENISMLNAEEAKLQDLEKQLHDVMFAKGTRDTQTITDLRAEITKTANRISIYDGRLLRLEAAKPLKDLLARERKAAVQMVTEKHKGRYADYRQKAESKLSDTMQDYRNAKKALAEEQKNSAIIEKEFIRLVKAYDKMEAKSALAAEKSTRSIEALKAALADEIKSHREDKKTWEAEFNRLLREYETSGRNIERLQNKLEQQRQAAKEKIENRARTEMRHKVLRVVKELDSMLKEDSKKRHVPDSLKKAVAGALDILNLDTTNTEERVAKYQKLIAEETDPDKIDAYQVTLENIIRAGEKMGEKLAQLHTAYQAIQKSDDPDIQGGYDAGVAMAVQELAETIGDTPINKLSMDQLEDVYHVFKAILTRVRDANKSLIESIKESISERASYVISEVKKAGGTHADRVSALDGVKRFGWNNMKPVYAFEEIGSNALTTAFNNVRKGEDTWALDVTAARAFYLRLSKEYGFDKWDMDKSYTFTATSGQEFQLTLQQMMSLYAYSKREQADEHLRLGGFVFDSNIEFKKQKGKDGKKHTVLKYKKNTADAHQIDLDTMQEIVKTVSEIPGVKDFVDGMQDYLSTTMGAKGNEVSMKMYGIKLFKEKNYFPLKSAKQFLFEQNQVSGEVRIKNSGFTNKLVAGANNPIILSDFMDVWCQHVNDMSMYHAFTLPLEDFNRIFNFTTGKAEGMAPKSVKGTIQDAYGPAANAYIKQLITDLNGGAVTDPREVTGQKLMGKWKKAKVMASLSVVIQQPTSIARAFAMIDPKYFVGKKTGMSNADSWEELKKYAPVAIIKEMGYFDTGMGLGVKDFIQQKEYEGFKEKAKGVLTDSNYRDEVLGKAPAKADEITWVAIWNAVKRETAGRHPELKPGTEEYLKAAGERFTEVITKTQVYDSVLARSAHMRSKSGLMNMVTAFMAEPTTTINMAIDAVVKASRGDKKSAFKIMKAVVICNIINNALASLVYAMRDDDEEETFLEKYMQSLASGLIDDINPMTYFPWLKDVWSVVQGYSVDRSDMSLISDIANAGKGLYKAYDKDEDKDKGKNLLQAWLDFAGSVGNFAGFPLENMIREGYAFANTWKTHRKDWTERDTTWSSLGDAIGEALANSAPVYGLFADDSKVDDLYDAIIDGDKKYLDRLKSGYADKDGNFSESKYNTALKKALRENDDRIEEAAQARIDGDFVRYSELLNEIKDEGKFDHAIIRDAIYLEEKELRDEDSEVSEKEADAYVSSFTQDDYFSAVFSGNTESAEMIYQDLLDDKLSEGYLQHEAKDAIASAFATEVGNRYMDGEITRVQAIKLLKDNTDKGEAEVKKWDFELKFGFAWGNRARKYRTGKISRADLEKWVMDIDDADRAEAKAYVDFLDLEMANPNTNITAADAESFFEHAEPSGIDIDTYLEFKDKVGTIKGETDPKTGKTKNGTEKANVLKYIHSLPLTVAQKDALYYAQGYPESTIKDAPWH